MNMTRIKFSILLINRIYTFRANKLNYRINFLRLHRIDILTIKFGSTRELLKLLSETRMICFSNVAMLQILQIFWPDLIDNDIKYESNLRDSNRGFLVLGREMFAQSIYLRVQGFSIKMKLFAIDAQLLSPKVYMCTIRSVHALTKLYTFSLEMSPHKKMTKNWDF